MLYCVLQFISFSVFFLCSMYSMYDFKMNKLCGRPPQYAPPPCKLTFDLLILKVVSESRVTWSTSVRILVFLNQSINIRLIKVV